MGSEVRIVVLQRGWVYVGRFERDGDTRRLTNAKCVRRWGTTKGLGELVNGPLRDTVLDATGTVEYHAMTEVNSIICNADKWYAALE